MVLPLAHAAITYLVPLLCGGATALLAARGPRHWLAHVLGCALTVCISIAAQCGCFLVLAGVMTGNWPQAAELTGLWYALAWFALVALFTTLPVVVTTYVVVTAIFARKPSMQLLTEPTT